MKQVFLMSAVIFLAALLPLNATATPFGANITISDKNIGSNIGWYGPQEDNEVEPGMATGQNWDLEGFFLNGTTLTMVGGFNFKDGNPGYASYTSGDIFFDINGDANYAATIGSQGQNAVPNSFGYDYVIDLDFVTSTYDVYAITSSATVNTVYYSQNQGSSPWRYVGGGTKIDGAQGIIGYSSGLTDEQVDAYLVNGEQLLGGSHNAIVVNLGFLSNQTDFITHFTMGCGNDNLMGRGMIPNPEPATLILMGCGLIGLAGLGRKNFQRAKIE